MMAWNGGILFTKSDNFSTDVLTSAICTGHNLPQTYVSSTCFGGYTLDGYGYISQDTWTDAENQVFVHFLTSLAFGIGDTSCDKRTKCVKVKSPKSNKPFYLPFYEENTAGTGRILYVNAGGNIKLRPQNRYSNYKIEDFVTVSSTMAFDMRAVVSDWWAWSCDASIQVNIPQNVIDLLNNYYNAYDPSRNNMRFGVTIKFGKWTGASDGEKSYTILPGSTAGWKQIYFNGDSAVNRTYSCSRITSITVSQYNLATGTMKDRVRVTTGNSLSGEYKTNNIGGNGTYAFKNCAYNQELDAVTGRAHI